jgi:hypothetical protein
MINKPQIVLYADYSRHANGRFINLEISDCIKLHEKNANAKIEFPIEMFVGGTWIDE